MILINDNFHLMADGKVYEGGTARNEAIIKYLRKHVSLYKEVKLNKSRISNALSVFKLLIKEKNETLFFFYPTVGVPLSKNNLIGRILQSLFFKLVKRALMTNRIIFDICDLKYEQAIDLEIDQERLNDLKKCEYKLFTLEAEYIFASESMMNYAMKKYGMDRKSSSVLKNGGCKLSNYDISFLPNEDKINVVYAGTLNKGRSIEKMIDELSHIDYIDLYLLGSNGDWINKYSHSDNIKYMGQYEENKAHYIVSKCDIGLIPYKSDRLYYNLAYPTKLAFYVTAGITFLSTPVDEVKNVHEKYSIGFIEEIDRWDNTLKSVTKQQIEIEKRKVKKQTQEFEWNTICRMNKTIESLK